MEATREEMVEMIIQPKIDNRVFLVDGEIYLYWAEWVYRLKCKLFGHKDMDWHCVQCHACLDHSKEGCEY